MVAKVGELYPVKYVQLLILIDMDPEEDVAAESSDEGSDSQESHDDLAGTEHYVEVGYEVPVESLPIWC